MEFHQTRRGQKYYDHTLPKLIQAIEDLTDTLKGPKPIQNEDNIRTITVDLYYENSIKNEESMEKIIDKAIADAINNIGGEVVDIKPHIK